MSEPLRRAPNLLPAPSHRRSSHALTSTSHTHIASITVLQHQKVNRRPKATSDLRKRRLCALLLDARPHSHRRSNDVKATFQASTPGAFAHTRFFQLRVLLSAHRSPLAANGRWCWKEEAAGEKAPEGHVRGQNAEGRQGIIRQSTQDQVQLLALGELARIHEGGELLVSHARRLGDERKLCAGRWRLHRTCALSRRGCVALLAHGRLDSVADVSSCICISRLRRRAATPGSCKRSRRANERCSASVTRTLTSG